MKLNEAIKHCYEVAEEQCENKCGRDHIQLAKWLEELKEYRKLGKIEVVRKVVERERKQKSIKKKYYERCYCPPCRPESIRFIGRETEEKQ